MAGLEVPQLAYQEVELGVGDLRRVERVVALVVVGDQLAQLGGPSRRGRAASAGVRRVGRGRPRSGGDARADHRVLFDDVVEGDGLPRRHRALGHVELHHQPVIGPRE